jgi:hypothetical protein
MSILIAVNVQSFMQNLLMSLKRLLSEASIIKTSYNTNILVFAFVSFKSFLFYSWWEPITCRLSCSWVWICRRKKGCLFRACSTNLIIRVSSRLKTYSMWYLAYYVEWWFTSIILWIISANDEHSLYISFLCK